jgi:lipoprotein-releasing system permease protein
VIGIFDLGNKGANQRSTFVALRTAQSLLGLPGGVSSLGGDGARRLCRRDRGPRIIAATPASKRTAGSRTNADFFTAVSAQSTAEHAIRFFVGLSVAFGIASVLAVVVVQKSREIGILRAMGISRAQILRLFLLQGGLAGSGRVRCSAAPSGAGALVLWQQTGPRTPTARRCSRWSGPEAVRHRRCCWPH